MIDKQAVEQDKNISKRLWTILKEDGPGALAIAASSLRIADLALAIELLPKEKHIARLFSALPVALAAEVLEEAHPEIRDILLKSTSDEHLRKILAEADADDAVYFLDHLDDERASSLLHSLDQELQLQLTEQLDLDGDSAGRIMQRECSTVRPFHSCKQAIAHLSELIPLPDGPIYVIDSQHRLSGVLTYRQLVFNRNNQRISALMEKEPIRVQLQTDREEVAALMQRYHLTAIPVVDGKHHLRGIITWDDAIDVIEAEAQEDILALAGTSEDIDDNNSVVRRALYRLPFLLLTVVGGFIVAGVIDARADNLLVEYPILMAFLPLVPALGGNIGLQCSTVTIRSLAMAGDNTQRNFTRSLREIATGSLLAVSLAILCGLGALGLTYFNNESMALSGVIACSLLVAAILAATLGVLIPNACVRYGIDPAIASGPFVTVLNDITGVTIYLLVASALLHNVAT